MITIPLAGFVFLAASALPGISEVGSIALFGVGLLLLGRSLRRLLVYFNSITTGEQSTEPSASASFQQGLV